MNGLKRIGRARELRMLSGLSVIGAALVMSLLPVAGVEGQVVAAAPPHCSVGSEPWQPGYDPVSHEVYVPNFDSSSVTVLKGTCTVAATIKLPSGSFPVPLRSTR